MKRYRHWTRKYCGMCWRKWEECEAEPCEGALAYAAGLQQFTEYLAKAEREKVTDAR